MSFFQNTCKPKGIGGKIMVNMMNTGHSSMAEWGFTHIEIRNNYICLDIGCGGGANVKKLLAKTPYGKVTGIDYSEISVIKSQKINKAEIENRRCEILQGNVMKLPFGNETFDIITAFVPSARLLYTEPGQSRTTPVLCAPWLLLSHKSR